MGASLLILDDEPLNLEIIGEYLSDSGYQLSFFDDPEVAWSELDANPRKFDVIVMDRMMPKIDGLTLLRRIKADERMRHLPVIMQTAAASPDQVSEGLASGAHYYLTKPFRSDALLSIVRAAVQDGARWADISLRIANHSKAIGLLAEGDFLVRTLEEAQALSALIALGADDPDSVVLGLSELLVNGIEHGNLGIDFQTKTRLKSEDCWLEEVIKRLEWPENVGKRVRLHLRNAAGEISVRIEDEGAGFEWQRFLELSPERAFAPNGRGIAITRMMAFKSMEYLGRGNVVEVRFPAAQARSEAGAAIAPGV